MIERKTQSLNRARGVILLVSLVLLLAMTLIGVSAIDSSSLQSQMSRNTLYARNLYQASLSEIQAQHDAMSDLDYLETINGSSSTIPNSNLGVTTAGPGIALSDADFITQDTTDPYTQSGFVVFSGTATPPSGYSLGLYIGMEYEINTISTVTNTNTASNQTQGLKRVAPIGDE